MKRERYAWVTLIPTAWLLICTLTAGLQKLLSPDVKIGFLSHAFKYQDAAAQGKLLAPAKSMDQMQQIILNDYVDAALAGAFVAVVVAIAIFGVIYAVRALGNPSVSTVEVGGMAAAE
jgi:carbon starvation protein CstA